MQVGGHLEQFAPPAEILSAPASGFVADFVGADRGLKRLSLTRVSEVALQPVVTARVGDAAGEARARTFADAFPYLLLLDASDRPIGWVSQGHIPATGALAAALATPMSPLLDRRTTLKDALSMMLDADVQTGIVVDRTGRLRGVLSVEAIAAALRPSADPGVISAGTSTPAASGGGS
jgi:osmoprotectant transport system ATP-binding protein